MLKSINIILGIENTIDKCPKVNSTDQSDNDGDTVGDVCDNCRNNSNKNQVIFMVVILQSINNMPHACG